MVTHGRVHKTASLVRFHHLASHRSSTGRGTFQRQILGGTETELATTIQTHESYRGVSGSLGRYRLKRFFTVTRWRENLSSGEKRAVFEPTSSQRHGETLHGGTRPGGRAAS